VCIYQGGFLAQSLRSSAANNAHESTLPHAFLLLLLLGPAAAASSAGGGGG
jgi:hypothetical protein